jgi:hypothetical protein
MGNRAVITTAPYKTGNIGIYVHWNGGRASIEGFLQAAKELGYRSPGTDSSYGLARLVQAIGLYFGADKETSLGIGICKELDTAGDNGTYLIGKDWEIVGRKFFGQGEEEIDLGKTEKIKQDILHITKAAAAAAKAL